MKVLLAHPGTQTSFRMAAELHRLSALGCHYTGLAIAQGSWSERAMRLLPRKWQARLSNRRIEGVPARKLHLRPFLEAWALMQTRRHGQSQKIFHRRNVSFQRSISTRALGAVDAVIGFDTSSAILGRRCVDISVPFLLDQTHPDSAASGHELIKRRYPAWADEAEVRSPEVYEAEREERRLASLIQVASSFTRTSLIEGGVESAKIRLNPLGVDCSRFSVATKAAGRPLTFLFVGAMTARKGVPLLVDAWRELAARDAELWLVGPASGKALSLLPKVSGLRYLGRLPADELAAAYQRSDVFVFPSYCEGFGQVILEAMACGLPVITTTASGAPDIITPGRDGWLIERDSVAQLVEAMRECLDGREGLGLMASFARQTAERFSWPAYGKRLVSILQELVDTKA